MKNYMPIVVDGHYVDNLELFERGKQGETHICECRQNHDAFFNRSAFMKHINLKCHTNWVNSLTVWPLEPSLREEQDSEYERALKEDQQKTIDKQEKELQLILEESEAAYIKEEAHRKLQIKRDIVNNMKSGYNFRFIFPNGKRCNYTIPEIETVEYMRNYIDVYIADNNLDIPSYDMFIYPNKTLDDEDTISDVLESKMSIFIRCI